MSRLKIHSRFENYLFSNQMGVEKNADNIWFNFSKPKVRRNKIPDRVRLANSKICDALFLQLKQSVKMRPISYRKRTKLQYIISYVLFAVGIFVSFYRAKTTLVFF